MAPSGAQHRGITIHPSAMIFNSDVYPLTRRGTRLLVRCVGVLLGAFLLGAFVARVWE